MEEHKKLYEEALVKEIMMSTALYVHELMNTSQRPDEDELCALLEANFRNIIDETLSSEEEDDYPL